MIYIKPGEKRTSTSTSIITPAAVIVTSNKNNNNNNMTNSINRSILPEKGRRGMLVLIPSIDHLVVMLKEKILKMGDDQNLIIIIVNSMLHRRFNLSIIFEALI